VTSASLPIINPAFPLPSLDQLDGSLEYRLALLIAPAGSGKTELLRAWVTQHLHPRSIMTAWLNLTEADNYVETFTAHLEAAVSNGGYVWVENRPGKAGPSAPAIPVNIADNLTDIINHLADLHRECVLILDHYQVIQSQAVHSEVQYLIEYLPEQVHVVIASRSEPRLNLGRYRVRRQMVTYGL